MSPQAKPAKHSAEPSANKSGIFEIALPIRLVIAVILVIFAALINMPVVKIIVLILAAVISGYDVFLEAVDAVAERNYFSTQLVVVFAAVIAFVIGYSFESVIMLILFQLSKIAVGYIKKRAAGSAVDLCNYMPEDVRAKIAEVAENESDVKMDFQKTMEASAESVLRFVFVLAVLMAILLPLISGVGIRIALHRALMIILVASPLSVVVSFGTVALTGLGFGASKGILYNNVKTMEDVSRVNIALFDKAGVFSEDAPHVIGLQSDILDRKTFLNFLAHASYYSEQPFAKAISDFYDQDYMLDVISDFQELPAVGVALKIGNAPVVLASKSYYDSLGNQVPDRGLAEGIPYYLSVAGKYVGKVVISSTVNQEASDIAGQMTEAGVPRNILLTEDDNEASQTIGDQLHFTEVYGECDTDKKLRLISDLSKNEENTTAFIYTNGIEGHSAADVDIRVSRKGKYADILVLPDYYLNIPESIKIAQRSKDIMAENAVFVFFVKAILIFLSIIGYSNLWFVVFMDSAAAIATLLNAIRVTSKPLISRNKNPDFDDEE